MIQPRAVALLLALAICSQLSSCAVYEKCGFSGCPGDKKITAEVRSLFSEHPALEAPNELYVQTLNSVVYLTGLVNSPREQQLATLVAREAPGVTNVVNSIGLYDGR
jgi:osmotically-inducible protein OsmY